MALTVNLRRTGSAAAFEKECLRMANIEAIETLFYDTLDALKAIDPQWEAWYDDDNNIPVRLYFDDWSYMKPIIERMRERIHALSIKTAGVRAQ